MVLCGRFGYGMALNLITLTKSDGAKVDVNPAMIETVETVKDVTRVMMNSGAVVEVRDPQAKVRDRANFRSPDGFG